MNLVNNQSCTQNLNFHLLVSKTAINQKFIGRGEANDSEVNVGEKGLWLLARGTPERNDSLLLLSSLLPVMTSSKERVSCVRVVFSLVISANLEERRLVFTRVGEKGREITAIVLIVQIVSELSSDIDLNLFHKRSTEKIDCCKVVTIQSLENSSILGSETVSTENVAVGKVEKRLIIDHSELERTRFRCTDSIVLDIARCLDSSYCGTSREEIESRVKRVERLFNFGLIHNNSSEVKLGAFYRFGMKALRSVFGAIFLFFGPPLMYPITRPFPFCPFPERFRTASLAFFLIDSATFFSLFSRRERSSRLQLRVGGGEKDKNPF